MRSTRIAWNRGLAGKRADYFAAGTLVVWDVDLFRDGLVRVYRATDPLAPTIYRRGERNVVQMFVRDPRLARRQSSSRIDQRT
jgi:Uma2 family endonuclease